MRRGIIIRVFIIHKCKWKFIRAGAFLIGPTWWFTFLIKRNLYKKRRFNWGCIFYNPCLSKRYRRKQRIASYREPREIEKPKSTSLRLGTNENSRDIWPGQTSSSRSYNIENWPPRKTTYFIRCLLSVWFRSRNLSASRFSFLFCGSTLTYIVWRLVCV